MSSNLAESNNSYRPYDYKFLKFKKVWKNLSLLEQRARFLNSRSFLDIQLIYTDAENTVLRNGRREHSKAKLAELPFMRFISAGTENTKAKKRRCGSYAVYLCGRREHTIFIFIHLTLSGSSLRAQRIHHLYIYSSDSIRFISAGAENTIFFHALDNNPAVHLCGRREHPRVLS